VTTGGGLVATGQAGLYDQWRRLRVEPGLHGMIDSQSPARAYEERVAPIAANGEIVRKGYDEGRVAYVPEIAFDGTLPQFGSFFPVDARFWRAPRNAADIADTVRWAARERIPVEVSGPDCLVSNLVEHPEKHHIILHLVNYNARKEASLGNVHATFRLPSGESVKEAVLYSPDYSGPRRLAAIEGDAFATFCVPVKTYSIVAVTW
jgi:hypothetical protein